VLKRGATGVLHQGRVRARDWERGSAVTGGAGTTGIVDATGCGIDVTTGCGSGSDDTDRVSGGALLRDEVGAEGRGEAAWVEVVLKLEALGAPRQQLTNEWAAYEAIRAFASSGGGNGSGNVHGLDGGDLVGDGDGGSSNRGGPAPHDAQSSPAERGPRRRAVNEAGGFPEARFGVDPTWALGSTSSGAGGGGVCDADGGVEVLGVRVLATAALGSDLGAVKARGSSNSNTSSCSSSGSIAGAGSSGSSGGGRGLGLRALLALGEQMVDLLEAFHVQAGRAHRDVKPENFCLGRTDPRRPSLLPGHHDRLLLPAGRPPSSTSPSGPSTSGGSGGWSGGSDAAGKLYLIDFGLAVPLARSAASCAERAATRAAEQCGAEQLGKSSNKTISCVEGGGGALLSKTSLMAEHDVDTATDSDGGDGGYNDGGDDLGFGVGSGGGTSGASVGGGRSGVGELVPPQQKRQQRQKRRGHEESGLVGSLRYLSVAAHAPGRVAGAADDLESAACVFKAYRQNRSLSFTFRRTGFRKVYAIVKCLPGNSMFCCCCRCSGLR